MSFTVIESTGLVRQLGARSQPQTVVTSADVADAEKLARIVQELRRDLDVLQSAWRPSVVEFQDVAVSTAGATVSLRHSLGARVRWYVVAWDSTGGAGHSLEETTATDENTLVLASYVAGTATVRIEAAG